MKLHLSIHLLLIFISLSLLGQVPDCEVIRSRKFCSIEKDLLVTEREYLLQINTKAGGRYADVEINYQGKNKPEILDARIEDLYGNTIRKLKNSEVKHKSTYTGYFHMDYMDMYFSLKHNEYPYRVYYRYRTKEKEFLDIANWSPILGNMPIHDATLRLEIPEGFDINILEKNIGHSVETTAGTTVYTWKTQVDKPYEKEIYAPPVHQDYPYVEVVPIRFRYGVPGLQDSWANLSAWEYNLNLGLDKLPASEQQRLNQLIAPLQTEKDKVKAIYHYLQDNHRYIYVSTGIGGLQSHPADYVVNNRYGDCKALTNYMKAALQHAGIPSIYTTVYAGSPNKQIDTAYPSQQFNHVILMVPGLPDTVWLECTNRSAPFGYLGTFTQGRYALPVEPNNAKLVKTPALQAEDVLEKSHFTVKTFDLTKAELHADIELRGNMFDDLIYLQGNLSKKDIEDYLQNHLPFQNYQLLHWDIDRPHRDSAYVHLKLHLSLDGFYRKYGPTLVHPLVPIDIPDFEQPENRQRPVQLDYPIYKKNTAYFETPYGYALNTQLQDTAIYSAFGHYKAELKPTKTGFEVNSEFFIKSNEISLEAYPEFYRFIASAKAIENYKLSFTKNH
jgi:transglutaminase-like putative cysteine protease